MMKFDGEDSVLGDARIGAVGLSVKTPFSSKNMRKSDKTNDMWVEFRMLFGL